MLPSIFNNNLFDDFFGFPFYYDNRAEDKAEKKLYGHHAGNLMKTDIKELDNGYELEIDLPGFKKDEIKAELNNGYLTVSAAVLMKIRKTRRQASTSDVSVMQAHVREAIMLAKISQKRTSRQRLNMAF